MPPDPEFRSTVVQAFAVTVAAPSAGPPDPSATPSSVRTTDGTSQAASSGPSDPRGPSILPDSGQLVGGLYKLVRLLGQGMFGKVYAAQRVDVPEHQVALKLLPRSLYATRNVERELVMLATVGHPNVVQLKDHGMTADYVWLTMPVYQGETLAERLQRGTIGLREAYDIFVPVARGLEALHAGGLRHQDVKPENIYLAQFGGRVHPVLLDLGVAAEHESTFCAGTALYGAPEQVRALNAYPGAVQLSEKMDTYCLGSTLLMALVGPEGFPGEKAGSRAELSEAHDVRATKPLGDGLLPELQGNARELVQETLKKWLALEANDRPTMTEVAEQLDVLLEPEREAAREEERLRSRQKASLLRFRIGGFAVAVAVFAGALVAFSKRETIKLAQELDAARREGAESFDKLDTCVASYHLSESSLTGCRIAREKDRVELNQKMESIQQSGSESEAERAREIQSLETRYGGRLRACEEDATKAAKESLAEREKLASAWDKERAGLAGERDELKTQMEQRAVEIAVLTEARNACVTERDRCQAGMSDPYIAPASVQTSRPGPAPATSGSGATPGPPPPPPTPPTPPPTSPPPPTNTSAPTSPPPANDDPY